MSILRGGFAGDSSVFVILLHGVTAAAVARSAWLLVGLVRVVPVHLRARTRKWGLVEGLTLAEIPVFLVLTSLLVTGALPVPAVSPASLASAAAGAALSRQTDFSVGCYCAEESRCHRSLLRGLLEERGAEVD